MADKMKAFGDMPAFFEEFLPREHAAETVPLARALGRVLAQDAVAPFPVPQFDSAAMDGWAYAGTDIRPEGFALTEVGESFAGHPFGRRLAPGECVRIMTGAKLPEGADTVTKQEIVVAEGRRITFPAGIRAGDNVRGLGTELAAGNVALPRGRRLHSPQINFLAHLGMPSVRIFSKPRIAFLSTGDELCALGEPLPEGCIYDSNRHTIRAMLTEAGLPWIDMGRVGDDPEALRQALLCASRCADAVITSGGVSVGKADFTRRIAAECGTLVDWFCAVKPGSPLAIGKIGKAIFFGLPGSPTAAQIAFYAIVRPALKRMEGDADPQPPVLNAVAATPFKKRPNQTEIQRAILGFEDGMATVSSAGSQKTGALHSMALANCLVLLSEDWTRIEPGAILPVMPMAGFL